MALINTVSMQLPVFMLSAYSSSEVVGYYMMANRILTAPIHLISRSVGQVYYKEAVDCLRLGKKKVVRIFGNTVKQIAKCLIRLFHQLRHEINLNLLFLTSFQRICITAYYHLHENVLNILEVVKL